MKKWLVFTFMLISSNISVLVFADTEIEQLKLQKICINASDSATYRFETFRNNWLTNKESSFNIEINFETLSGQHTVFLKKLNDFAKEFSQTPEQIDDLIRLLEKIDETHFAILDEISLIDDDDNRFVRSLPSIEEGLSEIGSELEHAKEVCPDDWHDFINSQIKLTKEWRAKIITMRSYIMAASSDRWMMFALVLESKKLNLKKRYAQKVRRELETVLTEIDAVLAADELYTRVHKWWQKATVGPGIGRSLGHHYLQYSKALRILKIDLESVRTFESELEALPDLFPGVRSQISGDLTLYKSLLSEQIHILETGGWHAVFKRQKMMAKKRWEQRDRYSKHCQASISAFIDASKENITEGNFNILEDIYYQQVVECSRV